MRGQNTRAVTEEGCMREDEGCMREDEGCMREDEGCMREDEGCMREDEGCMREDEGCMREYEGCMREDEGCMREDEGCMREDEGCMREDEGCMREDEGCMREDEGCMREDEGCMREDEGRMREIEEYMRDDEIEEDTSGLGEADFLNGLETGVHSDHPLPILSKGKEGVDELIIQQKADSTLAEMRRKAEKREDGYLWQDGVLVHVKLVDPGREWMRVVPYCRLREVIDVGHSGLAGRHFSQNKMVASITQHFTWPGLRKDVKAYCSACLECQKVGRQLKPKAPLMVTPIISVPYQCLACDLVGPLNRSKSGFRYILTVHKISLRHTTEESRCCNSCRGYNGGSSSHGHFHGITF